MTRDGHARGGRKSPGKDYSRTMLEILPEMIRDTPMSIRQIAEVAGRNRETVRHAIEKLRDQLHIAGWDAGNVGDKTALYRWGPGQDAEKPRPLTDAEKSARYRATENGKKVCEAAVKRWRRSARGKDYQRSYSAAYAARRKFQTGGVAAIDPLLAAIIGRRA